MDHLLAEKQLRPSDGGDADRQLACDRSGHEPHGDVAKAGTTVDAQDRARVEVDRWPCRPDDPAGPPPLDVLRQAPHAVRLELVWGRLGAATSPKDMGLPGLGLHPLKGNRKGTWAVKVSGNGRVTFTFVGKDADAVDYEDYH